MELLANPFPIRYRETSDLAKLIRSAKLLDGGSVRPQGLLVFEGFKRDGTPRRETVWSSDLLGINQRVELDVSSRNEIILTNSDDPTQTLGSARIDTFRRVHPRIIGLRGVVGESGFIINPPNMLRRSGPDYYTPEQWEEILVKAAYYSLMPPVMYEPSRSRSAANRVPFAVEVDKALAGQEVVTVGFSNTLRETSDLGKPQVHDVIVINQAHQLVPRRLHPLFSMRHWLRSHAEINFVFAGPLGPLSVSSAST